MQDCLQGKIIKGIAGFYYIHSNGIVYECKAKGAFRNRKIKPLVGDDVELTVLDDEKHLGNIEKILPRHSKLIRPAVANVDQAVVVFAAMAPAPNFNLLDRFLLMMEKQEIPVIICINKTDLVSDTQLEEYRFIYEKSGYEMVMISTYEEEGISLLKEMLKGKTTALAGPSGVGKSSIMNLLNPNALMETGEISQKIQRGKHTTRHSEILPIGKDTYLVDTPGFSSIYFFDMEEEELKTYYHDFEPYEPYCRFRGCNHIGETECGVKQAVEKKELPESRYENYKLFFEEIKSQKKY